MGRLRIKPGFLVVVGFTFLLILVALWWNVFVHYQERKNDILRTWLNLETQITQNTAHIAQVWLQFRVEEQSIPLQQAEREVITLFVNPIRLLQSGHAWIYNNDYVIADQRSGFPDDYRGLSIAEIFEMQSALGASHYTDLVHGVQDATDGTGWYIWLPETGREYVAWTSIRVLEDTWTIGLTTPESEILDFTGIINEYNRNLAGAGGITLLLALVYISIWNRYRSNQAQVRTLEKAIIERSLELENSEKRYRQLVEQITAVTYIDAEDETSSTLFISPQVEKLTGYTVKEWLENPNLWFQILHPDDLERVRAEHDRTNKTGAPFFMDYRMITKDGRTIWVHDEAKLHEEDGRLPRVWHGIWQEITARVKMEEELRFLSTHDALTGVYNRAFFQTEMTRLEKGRAYPVSIITGDVDKLKDVNDHMGHAVGDAVLRLVASIMVECFRSEDIVARTGGDEFSILLPGTDSANAAAIMKRLEYAFTLSTHQPNVPPLSVSLGCATAEQGGSLERTLQEADDNMYRQKLARRGASSSSE